LLSAAQSFCNADQIQREGYICIIAQAKDGTVLGTADLNTRSKVVNNVYVREEARKQGLGRQLMEAVEDSVDKPTTLKLTVMSKNTPAVSLYKKLGYEAPGVYGFLDATPFDFLIEMEKKLS
jgi:ribosomal protein S18 acetylase RimI-like enzyme